MLGKDIDDIVSGILSDPDRETWTLPNRIRWMNAGVRDIATFKPKATTVSESVLLTPNVTRQAVPANAIALLDLTANMGADGLTPGRAISTVTADRLAASVPGWRSEKGTAVKHLVVDDRDPSAFYVYPALKVAGYVEALLHKHPVPIAELTDTLPLDASYQNALVEYVLHMAYAQDGENADHAELSLAHYNKYAQTLGIQVTKQKKAGPTPNSAENPTYPAVDKNGV